MAERVERQPAYVLHERAYRETSAILELFTRDHGCVAVVARGLRAAKPRFSRGSLRALQPLECAWLNQGDLGQLTAAEACGLPLALSGIRLQSALYLNELLVRLLHRHDPHPLLFDAYARLLVQLPESADALGFQLRCFEALLLSELGYGIEFTFDSAAQAPVDPCGRYRAHRLRGRYDLWGGAAGIASRAAARCRGIARTTPDDARAASAPSRWTWLQCLTSAQVASAACRSGMSTEQA